MKVKLEEVTKDVDSSFRILLTPNLNDIFYWHFHPEYEIVFVEGASGTRHIGDHISRYEGSDLVFIGPISLISILIMVCKLPVSRWWCR